MSDYTKVSQPELLFQSSPKIIDSVIERRPTRIFPKSRTALAGDSVEFEFQSDMLIDLASAVIHFDLQLFTAAAPTTVNITTLNIASAMDVVKTVETWYNDVTVDRVVDAATWGNQFLAYSASTDWANSTGTNLLGLFNQGTTNATAIANSTVNRSRDNGTTAKGSYSVPLSFLSGFYRAQNYLPMLGNKLRIALQMELDKYVIALQPTAVTGTYKLLNISLMIDTIIVERSYQQALISAMASDRGFRIPYTAYQTGRAPAVANTEQNFKVSNTNSNSLSLFLLHDQVTDKVPAYDVISLNKHCYPMDTFSQLSVTSGSRKFTPNDDIRGFGELYNSTLKCINGPSNLNAQGWIDFVTYTSPHTPHATSVTTGLYGNCLMGVNLSKTLIDDDAVINSGLDCRSNGATTEMDVKIVTTAALDVASVILTNIVHKRALVFKQSAVNVEL